MTEKRTRAPVSPGGEPDARGLARFTDDTRLARKLIQRINRIIGQHARPLNLMEVCGTHTMAISSCGVRRALDPRLRLVSGPGCPVCVTAQEDIDRVIGLAREPGITIATFGDMMRVPGTRSSLELEAAEGADVRVIYSPLDALKLAREVWPGPSRSASATLAYQQPDRRGVRHPGQGVRHPGSVVLLGVGFETTAPTIAAPVKIARNTGLTNFLVLPLLKTMPAALRAIARAPRLRIDGFILPGHVSTVIGSKPYEFLAAEFGKPCCITGFELLDLLQGIMMLLEQLTAPVFAPRVEIQYSRSVFPKGNRAAQDLVNQVFKPSDANWRGLGRIRNSGLTLRKPFQAFDALQEIPIRPTRSSRSVSSGCRCGDVLLGAIVPTQCRQFARECTPENPFGPCMVSSEGACAAYYKYER